MSNPQSLQLRVGVDVGSRCHSVAVGLRVFQIGGIEAFREAAMCRLQQLIGISAFALFCAQPCDS